MVRYGKKEKRVALYLRVSTGEQTTKNQRRELEAAAERHGWPVAAVFEDAGISGAKGRKDRPGLDAMLKAVARREVDLVMAWSVDRLGRSLVARPGPRGDRAGALGEPARHGRGARRLSLLGRQEIWLFRRYRDDARAWPL